MKKILTLFTLAAFMSFYGCDTLQTGNENNPNSGNPEETPTNPEDPDGGEDPDKPGGDVGETEQANLITGIDIKAEDGVTYRSFEIVYDSENKISYTVQTWFENGAAYEIFTITLNGDGTAADVLCTEGDETTADYTFPVEYDSNGNVTKMPSMMEYRADSWIEVSYNSDGTLKEWIYAEDVTDPGNIREARWENGNMVYFNDEEITYSEYKSPECGFNLVFFMMNDGWLTPGMSDLGVQSANLPASSASTEPDSEWGRTFSYTFSSDGRLEAANDGSYFYEFKYGE